MLESKDITFCTNEGVFNFRVAAIILHNSKVLMVYNRNIDQYYSVGGRCKLREDTKNAIIRECREETGIDFEIDRLGFIHESFFEENGRKYHEISFFYYMKPLDDISLIGKNKVDLCECEDLAWVDVNELSGTERFYPEFFKTELNPECREIKHIITVE